MHMHASARTHKHPTHTHRLSDWWKTDREGKHRLHTLSHLSTNICIFVDWSFISLFHSRLVSSTIWTIPFSFGFCCKSNTVKMEPLQFTVIIVTTNHLSIGNLITHTVSRFIRVDNKFKRWIISLFLHSLALFLFLGTCSFVFLFLLEKKSHAQLNDKSTL